MTAAQLERAINAQTRMLILNSPNNPTGAVYTEELKSLEKVLLKYPDVVVLSDEVYERIYFHGEIAPNIAQTCPRLRKRIIQILAFPRPMR